MDRHGDPALLIIQISISNSHFSLIINRDLLFTLLSFCPLVLDWIAPLSHGHMIRPKLLQGHMIIQDGCRHGSNHVAAPLL